MTQATTIAVLKTQVLYESYTTSKYSTNTSTACDTPSIKVDITKRYTLSLCVNFQSFFLFWIACNTPSIKADTTEQQVARHNQPNINIYTQQIDNKILLISTTSGETFRTIYNTNQKNKNYHVHLGLITTVQILEDLYNPPDYFGYYVK